MTRVDVSQAKALLPRLLERVQAGEEILITKDRRPVARLVPYEVPEAGRRPIGLGKGRIRIVGELDAPLPDEELAAFEADLSEPSG